MYVSILQCRRSFRRVLRITARKKKELHPGVFRNRLMNGWKRRGINPLLNRCVLILINTHETSNLVYILPRLLTKNVLSLFQTNIITINPIVVITNDISQFIG